MSKLISIWNFICRRKYLITIVAFAVIIGFLDENSLVRRLGYEREISQLKEEIEKYRTDYEEDFIFNDRDLNFYWQQYAGQLPKEEDSLTKRMQMLHPVLLNNSTTFEVVVDNEIAAKDFRNLIPELQNYLRVQLKNSKVVMTVRVSEPTETVRPVGRVEKFQMMAQKNQALMQLKDEFGLELY